jgi:hypothetical protein
VSAALAPLAHAQEDARHATVDTAAAVRAALERFPRGDGPFVQMVTTLRCGEEECAAGGARAVLGEVALAWGARTVMPDTPGPRCRSAAPAESRPAGLRVQASAPHRRDGGWAVGVSATCGGDGSRWFSHRIVYRLEPIRGRWRATDILVEEWT